MAINFNKNEDEKEASHLSTKEEASIETTTAKVVTKDEPKEEVKKEADDAAAKKERIRKRNLGYI